MITLYVNPNCAFCIKTMEVAKELGVPLTIKDVHDPEVEAELMRVGGKKQMPFMVDDERNISLYESADIMEYLRNRFNPSH